MLIKYYKPYFNENNVSKIFNKWSIQGKANFIKSYYMENTTIETIINDENYFLSEIDILLISYNMKIPVIIYYHSKSSDVNNIKLIHFTEPTYINDDPLNSDNKYFFIKSSFLNIKDEKVDPILNKKVKQNILYLTQHDKKLSIPFNELKQPLKEEINNSVYSNFNNYLNTKLKKNEPIKFKVSKYNVKSKVIKKRKNI